MSLFSHAVVHGLEINQYAEITFKQLLFYKKVFYQSVIFYEDIKKLKAHTNFT